MTYSDIKYIFGDFSPSFSDFKHAFAQIIWHVKNAPTFWAFFYYGFYALCGHQAAYNLSYIVWGDDDDKANC